ncbi:hypothetical protein [Paractinoplanes deccanensis]|uniref:hypothetical protein n=1 Tax=Paractinoplanes deccanensis TaxID=113561 RepID=UPI001942D601|nr:hypothetical protein [Actinoplanes deccanensis]
MLAAAAIGAIEVSCRLSISVLTPAVRILVIVIIASLVIALYHDLSPAVVALLVVAAAIGDVDMARRLTQPRDPRSFRTV